MYLGNILNMVPLINSIGFSGDVYMYMRACANIKNVASYWSYTFIHNASFCNNISYFQQ